MELGTFIRNYRWDHKISQREFAKKFKLKPKSQKIKIGIFLIFDNLFITIKHSFNFCPVLCPHCFWAKRANF